jgi:hypothetical protein
MRHRKPAPAKADINQDMCLHVHIAKVWDSAVNEGFTATNDSWSAFHPLQCLPTPPVKRVSLTTRRLTAQSLCAPFDRDFLQYQHRLPCALH